MVILTYEPLDPGGLCRELATTADGAVATFLGVVRDSSEGRSVRALEYEAYEEMAQVQLEAIGQELAARWGAHQWVLAHRLGWLNVGEVSMVIALATAHRQEAFEACRWAVEQVKTAVPIWKKEHFLDEARWVGSPVGLATASRRPER